MPLTEILVLTFTERAATELRQRIRSKLESILRVADDGAKRVASQPGGGWLIDEVARQNLSRALLSFDGASIGTIHGFFGRVLTEHAFASGRLFDETFEDGRALFGRAFKTALRRSLARRPSGAADLLALWLEQSRGGIERLDAPLGVPLLAPADPAFILGRGRCIARLKNSPLFDIDLTSEADQFKLALKAAKINANTVKAMMLRMTIVADLIRALVEVCEMVLDDAISRRRQGHRQGPEGPRLGRRSCATNRRGIRAS